MDGPFEQRGRRAAPILATVGPVTTPATLRDIPGDAPRRAVTSQVLASFAVAVLGFALTLGYGAVAQRNAADDNEELAKGYVPAALKLGQLRATQATIATLVDGIPDERNPLSTRLVLETLVSVRRAKIAETRAAFTPDLASVGGARTHVLAAQLTVELDVIDAELADDKRGIERLFGALDDADKDGVNRQLAAVATVEHEADRKVRALSDRVASSMDDLSARSRLRERRALVALLGLAAFTLSLGLFVSLRTRRLLAPLARVTARARAVARGDLTPHQVEASDNEIGQLARAFETMVGSVAQARDRAVANERFAAIGKMAAHVTHEIRNPLSSIGLNIEMLDEELGQAGAPAESRALLTAITREVERLEHLSEEYLRVARLPSPRMEAEDLAGLVADVVAFARPEADRQNCRLQLDVEAPLPPVLFDEAQIRQALLNLLRNAREAMPDGGIIRVRVAGDGMAVRVDVEDQGGGIPAEIRARVFDPFFSTKGEGTGLGLAITRQILEAHGGAIDCETGIDHGPDGAPRGTRFRITLPLAPARSW
jgi:two-component system NtrC family sensor kinase